MTSPATLRRSAAHVDRPSRRRWFRRALPWLPAAAFALGSLPSAAVAQTVTTEQAAPPADFVTTAPLTVQGPNGWLKALDFTTTGDNVLIEAGGLITTQPGGASAGQFTASAPGFGGPSVTVEGQLFVGAVPGYQGTTAAGGPEVRPAFPPAAGPRTATGLLSLSGFGTLLDVSGGAGQVAAGSLDVSNFGTVEIGDLGAGRVDIFGATTVDGFGSRVTAGAGGVFNGNTLLLRNGGLGEADGAGSQFNLTGDATVNGGESSLQSTAGGAVSGTALNLVNGGLAEVLGAGSTMTFSGAVNVDGADALRESRLLVGSTFNAASNGGQFQAGSLNVSGGGRALVASAGAQATILGGAAVNGAGSRLEIREAGAFAGSSLAVTGGAAASVDGAGTSLTLTDAATVDGANSSLTLRNGGTFGGTSLAATGGGQVFNTGGATTTLTGPLTVAGGGSGVTVDAGSPFAAGSAAVSGGLLDVRTGGMLSLVGEATVTGGIARVNGNLSAARLLLNGGLLTGAGTIVGDVVASGRIAPGNSPGVLNIVGDFAGTPTAVYDIELQPAAAPVAGTDFDQIAVTGAATVNGGTVNPLPFGAGSFVVGTRYEFLTAAGGLTVLAPVTVNNPAAGQRFAQLIGPNFLALVVANNVSFAPVGDTFNTRAVAGALDAGRGAAGLGGLFDALDTLTDPADVRNALNGLSGELYGTQLTALNRSNLQFLDVLGGRDAVYPLVCGDCGAVQYGNGRAGDEGLRGWLETYGAGGRVSGDGNAAGAELGANGVAVGLSRLFVGSNGCLEVGAFYGFESVTTRVPNANSSVTDEVHRVGGFARASMGRSYVRATGFGGASEGEARRSFAIDNPLFPLADRTSADVDGTLAAGDLEVGSLFGGPGSFLTPVAGLRYVQTDRDGFAETGGVSALAVDDSSLKELRGRLGVRAGRRLALGAVPATLTGEAFYSRDLSAGTIGDYDARLLAAPNARFTARGTDFTADRVVLGPGLTLGDGPVRLSTQYRAGLSEASVIHAGDVRLEVCF